MPALPLSSLSPHQQAQAARIFQDAAFGSDPAAYAYELEAATGQLSGQRSQMGLVEKKVQQGKRSSLSDATSGSLRPGRVDPARSVVSPHSGRSLHAD